MEAGLFLLGLLIVAVAIYKSMTRRFSGPRGTVRGLLRQYHVFEKTGLPEQESLLRILLNRGAWRKLPAAFLAEVVARLRSKENVFRFVSLAEEHKFERQQLTVIAGNNDVEGAVRETTIWLVDFGIRLQKESRFKEAEFVQKLALALEPNQFFTKLPLATTYFKIEKYADAVPLFREGLAELGECADGSKPNAQALSLLAGDERPASLKEFKALCEDTYAACVSAAGTATNETDVGQI